MGGKNSNGISNPGKFTHDEEAKLIAFVKNSEFHVNSHRRPIHEQQWIKFSQSLGKDGEYK